MKKQNIYIANGLLKELAVLKFINVLEERGLKWSVFTNSNPEFFLMFSKVKLSDKRSPQIVKYFGQDYYVYEF